MCSCLLDIDFSYIIFLNVEQSWLAIRNTILDAIELFVPKTKPVTQNSRPVWFNKDIRHQINCLKTLRRKTKQWFNLDKLKRLQEAEDRLQKSIIAARVSYAKKLLCDCLEHSNYMLFRYIHSTTEKRSIPEVLYFDTQCGSNDAQNANLFNKFFHSIFTRSSTNSIDLISDMPSSLTELDFTQYDVYNILVSLDTSKAVGIDGIGPRILKSCALPLCYPLQLLFTKCLE